MKNTKNEHKLSLKYNMMLNIVVKYKPKHKYVITFRN